MDKPIGVFDSGIGGLTVVRALIDSCPSERIIYFGDTARVPYGPKSASTVRRYARDNTAFLLQHDIKMLVVACNTASALTIPELKQLLDIPVAGVIEPGARTAVKISDSGRIGVAGTQATVSSGAYTREIHRLLPGAVVVSRPCPLLVPLAEEGWTEHEATDLIVREYLEPMLKSGIDTLILGCTHYPVLWNIFEKVAGLHVNLVDSASSVAAEVKATLVELGIDSKRAPLQMRDHSIYVSDIPGRFHEVGGSFLGRSINTPMVVDVEGLGRILEEEPFL